MKGYNDMKTRKIISIFVTLSLLLAYMIPFASAAELMAADPVVWTFDSAPAGEVKTNKDGKDKEWYTENIDLGNGLTAYAAATVDEVKLEYKNGFEVDRNTETDFGDEVVKGLLKFGGKSSDTGRYLTYTPSAAGTLTVYVKHGSPTKANTDIRSLIVTQDTNSTTVSTVGTDNPNVKQDITVNGGVEVLITCDNNVGLAKLVYTPSEGGSDTPAETTAPTATAEATTAPTAIAEATTAPTATAEATTAPTATTEVTTAPTATAPAATAAPSATDAPSATTGPVIGSDLPKVTEPTTWTFDECVGKVLTGNVLIGEKQNLKLYGDVKITADGSNKTIGGVKYTTRLKLGGTSEFDASGAPSIRVLEFVPDASGELSVAFAHASGSGDARVMAVSQAGAEVATCSVEANMTDLLTCNVVAGKPVYIYCKEGGLNVYGVSYEPKDEPTPEPTPGATLEPGTTPSPTPEAKPDDPDYIAAAADAEALKLGNISDYSIYFDFALPMKGENGSKITWTSSNEKYISVQMVSSIERNWTGVVSRPMTDEECDETGGVPVTLTATVTKGNASVERVFDVSVRKFNPVYYNDFQSDVGQAPDGEGYLGIQDNVTAANGDKFRGIRVTTFDNTKSFYGFKHSDYDVEKNFDKRIMSTDEKKYGGKPISIDGTAPEENFAFYYSEWKKYGGSITSMPLWINLGDENGKYPEGLVIMSMDICMLTSNQKFNLGLGTSKPDKMCRITLNNATSTNTELGYEGGGVLRSYNGEEAKDFLYTAETKSKGYVIPFRKWVTATFVANSTTHLWDLYFDGMQIESGLKFRNESDFVSTIEFTMDRDYAGGSYLIDNIAVENITDDYSRAYWDSFELDLPYEKETNTYTIDKQYLLPSNGTGGLKGNKFVWKSLNPEIVTVESRSIPVDELIKFGYTEEQIQDFKNNNANYVTAVVADPADGLPETGKTAKIRASMEMNGNVYSKTFEVLVLPEAQEELTDAGKARADLNAITAVKNGMSISSEKNLDLPELGSLYGSKISWKSSDSSLVNENGSVSLPSKSKQVVLTATAVNGEATETKKFTLNLKGTSSGSSGGGGGGGGRGSSTGGIMVMGTTSTPTEKFETDAYTPEQSSELIFNDIQSVDWAKEAIEALYEKGVVAGYGNGLFAPNYSVTREQFVKMLVSALELDTNIESDKTFTDVKGDDWFAPYINAAAVLGVVAGREDGSFGVGESITRQDMAVMCMRALTVAGKTPAETDASFADSANISDYAKTAVGSMAGAGYLTGDENGSFNPLDTATRAQTAVVLYRIIKN